MHLHPRKEIKPKEVLVFLFVGFLSLLILFPPIGLDVFVCYWYGCSMAVPSCCQCQVRGVVVGIVRCLELCDKGLSFKKKRGLLGLLVDMVVYLRL